MKNLGKVNELLSICIQLGNEAGGLKGEKWKDIDDPMTIADVKAQTLIIQGIRSFYPNINIVGEESVEYEGDLGYDIKKLNANLIPEQYFKKGKCNNEFDLDEVTVWVDPLDGTMSYVKEEYDAVTTLIGVSYQNQPLMGVISQPYTIDPLNKSKFIFNPKIYFSHIGLPQIYYAKGEELDEEGRTKYLPYEFQLKQNLLNRPLDQLIGSTSKHRVKQLVLDFIDSELKPSQIVQCGGSGKKAILVLEGEVDYCVHFTGKASRWDTVACQALLQCYGGQITSIYGEKYEYIPTLKSYYNLHGGLYTLRSDVHNYLLEKTKQFKQENL